jgi:hypothetical protein
MFQHFTSMSCGVSRVLHCDQMPHNLDCHMSCCNEHRHIYACIDVAIISYVCSIANL